MRGGRGQAASSCAGQCIWQVRGGQEALTAATVGHPAARRRTGGTLPVLRPALTRRT